MVVHGGVKFDPYRKAFQEILGRTDIRLQETYPCSEGFIAFGDPKTELLRLLLDHGLFYEFVPVAELDSPNPTRHWLGTLERGVNYAIVVSTCAGMWGHIIGDTVRFESLDPPLLTFTGRTRYTLSAFGEHLINEEIEAAMASASSASRASVRDWHVGPVFEGALGYHQYVLEFLDPPPTQTNSAGCSIATSPCATPTTWHIAPRVWACPCRLLLWHGLARSTRGCDLAAGSGGRTRFPAWMGRASSPTSSSTSFVKTARSNLRSGRADERNHAP